MRLVSAFLGLLIGVGIAHADPKQVAEEHFKKANVAFDLGRFDDAIEGFSKAYEAWPRPEFLFNIAQSHRLAGHCKEAALFYRRYLSLNTKVTARQRVSINKLLEELDKCVAATPKTPDPVAPIPEPTPPPPAPPDIPRIVAPRPAVATTRPDPDDAAITKRSARSRGRSLVVEGSAGVGFLTAGDLQIGAQPTIAVAAGYPITSGRLRVEVGARVSYMPLPYDAMTPPNFGGRERADLFGAFGSVAVAIPMAARIVVRGDLGFGVMSVSGLGNGNPITTTRESASYVLPSVRFGVGADVALSRNLSLTIAPFGLVFGRGVEGMSADSLREIEVGAGLGFRL